MNKNNKRIIAIGLEIFIIVISILLIVGIVKYEKKEIVDVTPEPNVENLLSNSKWEVDSSTKNLLADNLELLNTVEEVLSSGSEPFSIAKDSSGSIPTTISKVSTSTSPEIEFNALLKSDLVMFQDGLEVLGIYEGRYVLYAYNRDNTDSKFLVFVEYSSGYLSDGIVLGNTVGLSIAPKYCNCVIVGNYEVVYVLK